jgi:hypothetical protein
MVIHKMVIHKMVGTGKLAPTYIDLTLFVVIKIVNHKKIDS